MRRREQRRLRPKRPRRRAYRAATLSRLRVAHFLRDLASETNKHLTSYLAWRSKSESVGADLSTAILQANPVLEAFGNAKVRITALLALHTGR